MTDVELVELEVADSFERVFPVPAVTEDWDDVLDRAGAGDRHRTWTFPRLRLVAIAAVILVAGLLVTPAFGIGSRLLDLIQGTPAPPEVQTFFATNNAYMEKVRAYSDEAGEVLHDQFAPVIASEARLLFAIGSQDGPIHLWVAPTKDGRQCELLQWGDALPNGQLALTNIASGGSQAPLKDEPVNGAGACEGADRPTVLMPVGIRTELRPSVTIVRVHFYDATITQVEVELDGAPSVWLPSSPDTAAVPSPLERFPGTSGPCRRGAERRRYRGGEETFVSDPAESSRSLDVEGDERDAANRVRHHNVER
jgi:hypothetical protein